jgi:uncharacterized membrane protein (UPF0127 family)
VRLIDLVVLPGELRLRVEVPQTRRERMRGLLGRRALEPGRGLLLERTRTIHTFGMRFPLRVAFLDRELRVLEVQDLPPGRIVLPRPGARHILEYANADLRMGDRLAPLPDGGDRNDSDERGQPFLWFPWLLWPFRVVDPGPGEAILPRLPPGGGRRAWAPIV